MGVAITLRRSPDVNYFRQVAVGAINSSCGDNLLLCSGFFQELRGRNPFQASTENGFATALFGNGVALTTVGIYNHLWTEDYRRFVRNLIDAGVATTALTASRLKWHAKVYILSQGETPVFGIVGSSNFTRCAFSLCPDFNYESDVFLWNDDHNEIATWFEQFIGSFARPSDYIRVAYNSSDNEGLTVADRLRGLREEVLAQKLKPLVIKE
jgi:hypothetical protein